MESMIKKKAYKLDLRSPDTERIGKYYMQFFKGTNYAKILGGNSHIRFRYGYYSYPEPFPLHLHAELELIYIRQGRGGYYSAGRLYPFQKRLLLIAKPNEIHAIMRVPLKEKTEAACFVFPLGWLGMDLDITFWPHKVLLSEEEAARFDMICGQVREEVKNRGSGYEDMIRIKFQEICSLVGRIVSQPRKERANPLVDKLRRYIDQHFAEKTSILEISKSFGYTTQYLDRTFKKSIGFSLKHYILQRRVMEARLLLETKPELKLIAIAEQVGFENYKMFHRIFKILTGVKPAAYRYVIQKAVSQE